MMIVLDSNNWAGKRFLFQDIYKFSDVFMRPKPCVVNPRGPINENLKDTRFVRVPGKAKTIN